MFAPIKPHHLETLKALTLSTAGVSRLSPGACRIVSFSIIKETNIRISETTVKRLYGFAETQFNPSQFTLNALAVYCGYADWTAFTKTQPDEVPVCAATENILKDPLISVLLETSVPTIILKANAPDFTIITYNTAYQSVTHTKKGELAGMTLWTAFDPEKAGGSGPTLLLEAFHEVMFSQRIVQMEPLHYDISSVVPHVRELRWWDIKIMPVVYDGVVEHLVLHIKNITDKVLHQDEIEAAILKELTNAEDLALSNVQLNVAVEQLAESHKQLADAKTQLEEANVSLEQRIFERTRKLFESEFKQRQLIDNAPVAIGILKGPNHVIETANKKMIDVWGKGNTVLNKQLAVALPEIEGQHIVELLDEVRRSGVAYINPELRAMLNIGGVLQARYFDLVYQPVELLPGVVDSIFVVAIDITEHVMARKQLERSESMLRLAVTAANIGIWSFDPVKQHLEYNDTFANILGWDNESHMTYRQALNQVTDEFRDDVASAVRDATINTGTYDFIYAHQRFNDHKLIWLRGIGKVALADSGEGRIFSGIISEIAEPGG